jgi:hypothetical protein
VSLEHETTALDRMVHTSDELCHAIRELHDYLTGITRPAERRLVTLGASAPNSLRKMDQDGRVAASIGFYNPQAYSIFVGVGGEIPDGSQTGAIEVPGNTLMVIPVAVQDVELGVKAADVAAGIAIVHLFRFWSLQPAYMGSWK